MDLLILTNSSIFDNIVLQGEIVPENEVYIPIFGCTFQGHKTTKITMKDIEVTDDLHLKLKKQMDMQYKVLENNSSFNTLKFDCILLMEEMHSIKHNDMYLESIDFYQLDYTNKKLYCQVTLKDT